MPDAPGSNQGRLYRALQGSLFGTAVGDAIGLPFEGISPRRIAKLKPFPLRHRFFFGRGMLSDDTEHTCMVAHALIHAVNDERKFSARMAWSLRWWFLGLPAGIGMATLKACLKLWLFLPLRMCGVFSAGNGPAMRSALVGAYAAGDGDLCRDLVEANTRITHTDPKAIRGAWIVAELARRNAADAPVTPQDCAESLAAMIGDDTELASLLAGAADSAARGEDAVMYAAAIGLQRGVTGYIYHTLPVVVQIVLRHPRDFEAAITEVIRCGGDTDTVAAIVGGIVGAGVGNDGIPPAWLDGVRDWPRTQRYLQRLVEQMVAVRESGEPGSTPLIDPVRILLRNAFFMVWVLLHGFRRLLPPY